MTEIQEEISYAFSQEIGECKGTDFSLRLFSPHVFTLTNSSFRLDTILSDDSSDAYHCTGIRAHLCRP